MAKMSFTDHPAAVGESYVEHLGVAAGFGGRMILGGLACLVHGLLPFLLTSTGSRTVTTLHDRMVRHRARAQAPTPMPLTEDATLADRRKAA